MNTNEHELFGASVSQRRGYNIMGRPGLEPGTNALKGRCSTD